MNDAVFRAALHAYQAGDLAEAGRLARAFLSAQPRHFNARHLLGVVALNTGDTETARAEIGAALKLDPDVAAAWYNYGCALLKLNQHEDALAAFDRAIALQPRYTDAEINRLSALLSLQRGAEALAGADEVLKRDPRCADALVNRGAALMMLQNPRASLAATEEAARLNPQSAEAHYGQGMALAALKRHDDALAAYDRALALNPRRPDILTDRAISLAELKRIDEAMGGFEAAVAIDPQFQRAIGSLMVQCAHHCDWRTRDADKRRFSADVRAGKIVSINAETFTISASAAEQQRCIETMMTAQFRTPPKPLWTGETYRHDRLRIAYLSADYRNHAVAYQIAGVLEHRDAAKFEITALSFKKEDDAMRQRLVKSFDRFIDADDMTDREIAETVRALEIDIAVDLTGLMFGGRSRIFSWRAAPVQVSFLGFPGTMGTKFVDYLIADRVVVPGHLRSHYSEKIVYLPGTFMPVDDTHRAAARTPSRAEAGLPESGFVFGAFNNLCKVTPEMFDVWIRLLKQTPGSVLWLSSNPRAPANLKREAAARGVDTERLVFAPHLNSVEDHLARLRLADLFLDTAPYNAHATACDALSAGLPVVTLMGETFAGRVAASLLHAARMDELITASLGDYEKLARDLSARPEALAQLRTKLKQNRAVSPFFDTARSARVLEAAFVRMWARQRQGHAPADMTIDG